MSDQTIAPVATPQAASAPAAAKESAKAPEATPKAEPPKTEAVGTVGTTAPNVGTGTKVNYYA